MAHPTLCIKHLASALVATAVLWPFAASAGPNCKCSANGKTYLEGEIVCIRLSSGDYTARCESVLNNTSWKRLGDGCPNASLRLEALDSVSG